MDAQSTENGVSGDRRRIGRGGRIAAAIVFLAIAGGFFALWASERGWINLRLVLGVCGFKARHGLPCPGCYWTHAAQAFVSGRFLEAFAIQPAAPIFCTAVLIGAVFALHIAIFGIDLSALRWARSSAGLRILIIVAIIVFFAGWLVTLARAILEKNIG